MITETIHCLKTIVENAGLFSSSLSAKSQFPCEVPAIRGKCYDKIAADIPAPHSLRSKDDRAPIRSLASCSVVLRMDPVVFRPLEAELRSTVSLSSALDEARTGRPGDHRGSSAREPCPLQPARTFR